MIAPIRYGWEFQLLADAGRYGRSGPLGLRSATDDVDDPQVRVAFAIGRAVGNAVVRNRVRRRLREILRLLDASGELRAGRYLVIASPAAASASSAELEHHLRLLVNFDT